jgi:hypothetical protein
MKPKDEPTHKEIEEAIEPYTTGEECLDSKNA